MNWLGWIGLLVFIFTLTYNPRSGVLNNYIPSS